MSIKHLNQVELADRWKISPRTLERWRWQGAGPRYIKIGGRVVSREADAATAGLSAPIRRRRPPRQGSGNG